MPSATRDSATSGITTSKDGERHIPSSTRPDGSVRKEIRVRAGYRPPEDVEVYKNRTAEAWKTRGTGGVPGAEFFETSSKSKSKPTRRTKVKEQKPDEEAATTSSATEGSGLKHKNGYASGELKETESVDPEAEKEKEARKLAKKLRQARDLQLKKDKGDSLLPEQFEKVIRMNELIRQLDSLGFDAEGQKKP